MTMKRKKTKAEIVREHFEQNRERFEQTERLLLERIEYHSRRRAEERAAGGNT
jgi:hypothetical protein